MKNIDVQAVLKYTKNLKILYVEDDLVLQEQTKNLFEPLFKIVFVANNGEEALEEYKINEYDIVISDVRMPKMNGVRLVENIKNINASQPIVIISAHSDSKDLLSFINLNVHQFIIKPINITNLLDTLCQVAKNITNANIVESYRKDLEEKNHELKSKNDELQSLVRILDSKLSKTPTVEDISQYQDAQITDKDLEELKELEIDISGASVLISLSNNISVNNIHVFGDMFKEYAKILENYSQYDILKEQIELLVDGLNSAPENFIKRVADISILLESFIYVLRMWRKHLLANEVQKAFSLHDSIVNDIRTIISIIDGTQSQIETEMEFF